MSNLPFPVSILSMCDIDTGHRGPLWTVAIPTRDSLGFEVDYTYFHIAVWLSGNKDVCNRMSVLETKSGTKKKFVAFTQEDDMLRFTRWFDDYTKMFDDFTSQPYPVMPREGTHTFHFVKFRSNSAGPDGYTDALTTDAWIWIAHHCEKPAFRGPDCFAFIDAKDAVQFKLKFAQA